MNLGLFLTVFAAFSFLVAIMAIGVIMGRRPISGSCGGIGRINGDDGECAICGGDPAKCEEAINDKSVVGTVSFKDAAQSRIKEEGKGV
ncbi:MAG: (Na+)-NQR maturation NqrM [Gammaproteobacteria bacterium]